MEVNSCKCLADNLSFGQSGINEDFQNILKKKKNLNKRSRELYSPKQEIEMKILSKYFFILTC